MPDGQDVPNDLMRGDVIQYQWTVPDDETWDHAVIVVDIIDGIPYVASHTEDVQSKPYTYFKPYKAIRFIHIERSNGNPPVKAKVMQSSDDAGTNPTGCGFSSTDNETYLGECFGGGDIVSGFRFNDVQIPRPIRIKYAYLIFTVDGTYTVPVSIRIFGDAAGNSLTFDAAHPPTARPTTRTDSAVLWEITGQWDLGMRRVTPNLGHVIEEIVNREDWVSGHSLSIILRNVDLATPDITNLRRVIAWDRANRDANLSPAKLIVAYATDNLPTPMPTFTPTLTPTFTPSPTLPPTNTPAPSTPVPPTPTPCKCILEWFFGMCGQSSVQALSDVSQSLQALTDDLQLFYRVRDEILSQTPEGQRLIDLYYTHSPETLLLVQADPDLEIEARSLIQMWTPNLQALVDGKGDTVTITEEQVNAVNAFLDKLVEKGSPELQEAIQSERENRPLESMIGMTMDQAWSYTSGYQFEWLPRNRPVDKIAAQQGRSITIKFAITDMNGAFVNDPSVTIQLVDANGKVVFGPIGMSDGIKIVGDEYHYALKTNGLQPGEYTLQVFYNSANPQTPETRQVQIIGKK